MSFSGMYNRKVWRSEKYNDFPISVKVPSVDVTDRLAVDSTYSVRVLLSFPPSSVNRVDGSVVGFEPDVAIDVAFGVVESAAGAVRLSMEVFRIRTSLRTMFLK